MGFQRNAVDKEKKIDDFQNFTSHVSGDRRKIVENTFRFTGSDWENLFCDMARAGLEKHLLCYFIGGKCDSLRKTASIRGDFAFSHWMDKYASRFDGWTFNKKNGKRISLPGCSEDDALNYEINGMQDSDFWDNNFVETTDGDDE